MFDLALEFEGKKGVADAPLVVERGGALAEGTGAELTAPRQVVPARLAEELLPRHAPAEGAAAGEKEVQQPALRLIQ